MRMEQKRITWLVSLGFIVVAGLVLLLLPPNPPSEKTPPFSVRDFLSQDATSTPPQATSTVPEGWTTYTDAAHGFQIDYPSAITPTSTFGVWYHLSNGWRAELSSDSTGTPVVAFPIFVTESPHSYPRYFDAEVRIGVSGNPADVADCTAPDPYASASSTALSINGVSFTEFPLGSAGMMQYMGGESFRTVHNGMCYAVEQLETGSSYQDATSSEDIPDVTLQNYYNRGLDIVKTFRFIPLETENPAPPAGGLPQK